MRGVGEAKRCNSSQKQELKFTFSACIDDCDDCYVFENGDCDVFENED